MIKSYSLPWPTESARPVNENDFSWNDGSANRVLDFHGDLARAKLTVLSDGNHHMALEATLQEYLEQHNEIDDIFYITLPPQVLNGILERQAIQLGNLKLAIHPDIYIGPEPILNTWHKKNQVSQPHVFAKSRGQAWLVRKTNPTGFSGLQDLITGTTRLFISNPVSEKASHQVYRNTLVNLAQESGLNATSLVQDLSGGAAWVEHGLHVHHREAPEAVASGKADVSLVYYHLALRYTRIFPDVFEMIPLEGSGTDSVSAAQEITEYAVSVIKGCNEWGELFRNFLRGTTAGECYHQHGLSHVTDNNP